MDMNSVTPGDWLLGLTAIAAVSLSIWAMLVAAALIFRRKAEYAQHFYENSPVRSLFMGLILGGGGLFVAAILLGQPLPLGKLAGWLIAAFILACSLVGGAGLVMLAGTRVAGMEGKPNSFSFLAKGAALIVLAGIVPIFGWFVYVPLVILTSFGTGLQALAYKPVQLPMPMAVQQGEAVQ